MRVRDIVDGSTGWRLSTSPSRGTTSACRSGRPTSEVDGRARHARGRRGRARRGRAALGCEPRPRPPPADLLAARGVSRMTAAERAAWPCAPPARASPSWSRTPTSTRRAAASPTARRARSAWSTPSRWSRSPVDWLKLVGFVPADDADDVRKAVFAAGAGVIGDYDHCSFGVEGQGTFLPPRATSPAVGAPGRDERRRRGASRGRLPARACAAASLDAYVAAHSYEEPAFDVVCHRERGPRSRARPCRLLPEPVSLAELVADVAAHLRRAVAPLRRATRDASSAGRRVCRVRAPRRSPAARRQRRRLRHRRREVPRGREAARRRPRPGRRAARPHRGGAVLRWSTALVEALAADVRLERTAGRAARGGQVEFGRGADAQPAAPTARRDRPETSRRPERSS